MASRYELLDPDPGGGVHCGPRWLAMYEMTDEAAAQQYIKDNERPWLHRQKYSAWPAARKRAKTLWRMLWQQIAVAGSTDQPPESVFMGGMNVPPDTDAPGLAAFTALYTDTHVTAAMSYT